MMTGRVMAVTGHRPHKLGGTTSYDAVTNNLLVAFCIKTLREHQPSQLISGMAIGVDQAFAQAALHCQIPLIAAVPCKNQERLWPNKVQLEYHDILSRAHETVLVTDGRYHNGVFELRNRWMVDHADAILAIWDGTPGGTGNCVKYATNHGKPIYQLWEDWVTYHHANYIGAR